MNINFNLSRININMTHVKNGLISTYHSAVAHASEWKGRAIAQLKIAQDKALPYFQDDRVAVLSLIGVNLLLMQIGDEFCNFVENMFPEKTKPQELSKTTKPQESPKETNFHVGIRDVASVSVGLLTVVGGVFAFSTYTQLPLSPMAIAAISAGTIFARILIQNKKS